MPRPLCTAPTPPPSKSFNSPVVSFSTLSTFCTAGGIPPEEPQRKRRAPWSEDVAETAKAVGGVPEVDMNFEGLGLPLVDPAEALAAFSARTSVSEHMMDSVLKVLACLC